GRRGHDVLIAYINEGWAPWQAADLPKHRLRSRRHRDPRFLADLLGLIRAWRPDVLQTWYVESDIVGGVAAMLTRTPWVLREPNTGAFYYGRTKALLRQAIARTGAKAIVANSIGGTKYWSSHPGTHLIANAVPVADTAGAAPAERGAQPLTVCAGRLEVIKNVDVLAPAVAQPEGVKLIVGGGGPRRPAPTRLAADL